MSEQFYDDDDFEMDDLELSPAIRAQLQRYERGALRAEQAAESRREKLRARRRIEDWAEQRQIRRDIDYLH